MFSTRVRCIIIARGLLRVRILSELYDPLLPSSSCRNKGDHDWMETFLQVHISCSSLFKIDEDHPGSLLSPHVVVPLLGVVLRRCDFSLGGGLGNTMRIDGRGGYISENPQPIDVHTFLYLINANLLKLMVCELPLRLPTCGKLDSSRLRAGTN